jgi:hypothetical protein
MRTTKYTWIDCKIKEDVLKEQNLYWTQFLNIKTIGSKMLTECKETDFSRRLSKYIQQTRKRPLKGLLDDKAGTGQQGT